MLLEEGGDVAIHGVAFGGHRPPLGRRDLFGDGGQFGDLSVRQPVLAQTQRADQAPVHDQVGIAPDGRGEVGVAIQVQTEVAHVLRRIDGLHLGAQHDLVDHVGVFGVARLVQQLVEPLGRARLALVPRLADGRQEVGQIEDLLLTGRVVDAVDQRRFLLLQRLGGADVGLDHHLLDQPVRLQRGAFLDGGDAAVRRHADAALGRFDLQGAALQAALQHGVIGVPKRIEDGLHDRAGGVVRLAVDGGLRLFVGQFGVRPHQAAHEPVARLSAVLVEDHPHGQAGAVLALLQAAQAVRQHFRQHRLDAVGEVGRVALFSRLPVQLGAGADIGGDIGDGDPDDPAAFIPGVFVAHGIDRVVVVARIGGVDGDEGHVAQVLAALQRRQFLILGLALHGLGEAGRDAVGVDGDQGGGAGIVFLADMFQDLAALGAIALVALFDGGQNQIAVAQVPGLGLGHQQHVLGAAVDRLDAGLARRLADDAKDAVGPHVQLLDQPGFPAVGAALELDQQAVAQARGGLGLVGDQQGVGRVGAGLDQTDVQFAVRIALDHIGDADGGQGAGLGKALAAALAQPAFFFEFADHFAQGPAVAALQPEMACDIGLLGRSGLAQEGDENVFVGETGGRPLG